MFPDCADDKAASLCTSTLLELRILSTAYTGLNKPSSFFLFCFFNIILRDGRFLVGKVLSSSPSAEHRMRR